MKKIFYFCLALLIFMGSQSALAESLPNEIEQQGLKLLEQLKLNDGEGSFPSLNMSIKWSFSEIKKGPDNSQLLIFRRFEYLNKEKVGQSQEFDVVVLKDDKVIAFEDAFSIPDRIIVKINAVDYETKYPDQIKEIYFYAELKERNSVIAALKSIYTGIRYGGFSGYAVKGKADYDPTPNRTWRIVDATFDLRRDSTPEVADIQAFQLDGAFDEYTDGAMKKITSSGEEGSWVAPWGQAAVIDLVR